MKRTFLIGGTAIVLIVAALVVFDHREKPPKQIEWTEYDLSPFSFKERKYMAPPPPDYGRNASVDITDEILAPIMGVLMLISLLAIICACVLPWIIDHRRRKLFPLTRPYRWGYANGFLMFAMPLFIAFFNQSNITSETTRLAFFATLFLGYPIGLGILFRNPIAFGIGTLLTLNPISWIINGIYLTKRMNEFDPLWGYFGEKRRIPPPLPKQSEPKYIIHDGTNQYEPMSTAQIKSALEHGSLLDCHFYWNEAGQAWRPISEITNSPTSQST